jgi:predicted O-methyltransferase YrrM
VINPFQPKLARKKYSWLPRLVDLRSEQDVHPHVPEERPELFDAWNAGTTELDLLNWLHATVRVLKPKAVLETGAASEFGTIALASACRLNGFGKVHCLQLEPDTCNELDEILTKRNCASSRRFIAAIL